MNKLAHRLIEEEVGATVAPDKVAIYIRWSTEDQGQGTTLAVQQEGCTHFLISQGWQISPDLIYVDDGYSGGTLDRPGLTRLRRAVDAGQVECVVVLKLDRLSRSVVDMVKLVMEEWGDRCWIKSAREPIDTSSHAGKMFFYTLTNFAEWERSVIRERTFSGKTKRAQAGRNPGFRPPYGYAPGPDHTFIPQPEEAVIVQRIFASYVAGQSTATIAAELNRTGPRFRGARPWNQQTVYRMLQNPLYIGDLHWGVRRYNPHHGRRPGEIWWPRNDAPLVVAPGAAPPLVDRLLFAQAKEVRANRPSPRRGQSGRDFSSPYLLTGLLRCGLCGERMRGRPHTGGRYYYCPGRPACSCAYLPTHLLDRIVAGRLCHHFASLVNPTVDRTAYAQEAAALAGRQHRLNEQQGRLDLAYREDQITIAEYRRFCTKLSLELTETSERVADLKRQRLARDEQPPLDPWTSLTLLEQRAVLRHFAVAASAQRQGRGAITCAIVWRSRQASF